MLFAITGTVRWDGTYCLYGDDAYDPHVMADRTDITVEEAKKYLNEANDNEIAVKHGPRACGTNVPPGADPFILGLSREGYWGW